MTGMSKMTKEINQIIEKNFALVQLIEKENELKNTTNLDATAIISQTNKQIKMMQF